MARSGRRTDYSWQGSTGTFALSATGVGVQTLVTVAASPTIFRAWGEILASIDGPVDGDKISMAYGLLVVTEEQVAAGASSMPDPADDLDAEWFWHGFIPLMA